MGVSENGVYHGVPRKGNFNRENDDWPDFKVPSFQTTSILQQTWKSLIHSQPPAEQSSKLENVIPLQSGLSIFPECVVIIPEQNQSYGLETSPRDRVLSAQWMVPE